jgi:hypothetical protein
MHYEIGGFKPQREDDSANLPVVDAPVENACRSVRLVVLQLLG